MAVAVQTAPMLKSIDPSTGEIVGQVPLTSIDEIPSIVERGRGAQKGWARVSLQQRADAIRPTAANLLGRVDQLALLITREMGKPLKDAVGEVKGYASHLEPMLQEIVDALQPETLEDENTKSI